MKPVSIRRNGGGKPASVQSPNKPEIATPETPEATKRRVLNLGLFTDADLTSQLHSLDRQLHQLGGSTGKRAMLFESMRAVLQEQNRRLAGPVTATPETPGSEQRFEGVVVWIDEQREFGHIKFPKKAGVGCAAANFWFKDLPEGAHDLRIGGRVSFRLARNERGMQALEIKVITLASDLPEDGWQLTTLEFFTEAIELYETKQGALHRDKFGRLFVSRRKRSAKGRDSEFRQVSFAQACDWLVNNRSEWIPDGFLKRHGITEQARLTQSYEGLKEMRIDEAVDQALALMALMENHTAMQAEIGRMNKEREGAFINGIICLRAHVERGLLALKNGYYAALKAG